MTHCAQSFSSGREKIREIGNEKGFYFGRMESELLFRCIEIQILKLELLNFDGVVCVCVCKIFGEMEI